MIRGVIFDLGNTLVYPQGDVEEAQMQGARELARFLVGKGLPLDEENFVRAFLEQRRLFFRLAAQDWVEYLAIWALRRTLMNLGHEVDEATAREGVRVFFAPEESLYRLYPDALPTLARLREKGMRLALISNATDDELIQRMVDELGLRPWLRPVISSAGVGIRKPDPAIFRLVLDEWEMSPQEAVMVGDNLDADILGAHLAGMRGILVHGDPPGENSPIQPDAVAETLEEIPAILENLPE